MIVTPGAIEQQIRKIDGLMEAFGNSYLHYVDIWDENVSADEAEDRNRAVFAFFGIKDMLGSALRSMEELKGHMEVCNAILAVNKARELKEK